MWIGIQEHSLRFIQHTKCQDSYVREVDHELHDRCYIGLQFIRATKTDADAGVEVGEITLIPKPPLACALLQILQTNFISLNIVQGLKFRDDASSSLTDPFRFSMTYLERINSRFKNDKDITYFVHASSVVQDVWLRCHTRCNALHGWDASSEVVSRLVHTS